MAVSVSIKKKEKKKFMAPNHVLVLRVHLVRAGLHNSDLKIYGAKDFQEICKWSDDYRIRHESWKAVIQRHRHVLIFSSVPERDEAQFSVNKGHPRRVDVNPLTSSQRKSFDDSKWKDHLRPYTDLTLTVLSCLGLEGIMCIWDVFALEGNWS